MSHFSVRTKTNSYIYWSEGGGRERSGVRSLNGMSSFLREEGAWFRFQLCLCVTYAAPAGFAKREIPLNAFEQEKADLAHFAKFCYS